MQNLEKRIAALEGTSASADEITIILRFVNPGRLEAEIHRLRDDDGNLWTRQPNETEQGLIDCTDALVFAQICKSICTRHKR